MSLTPKNHKQQYKCRDCQRQFLGGTRLNPDDPWHHYFRHKQTAAELAHKHNVSRRTISRHLKKAHTESAFQHPKPPTSSWIPPASDAITA